MRSRALFFLSQPWMDDGRVSRPPVSSLLHLLACDLVLRSLLLGGGRQRGTDREHGGAAARQSRKGVGAGPLVE